MARRKKVLVVDDVDEYLHSVSRALTGDCEVVTAASLAEAKKKMDHTIGLALVDIRLSEEDPANRDGLLLLAWLRENYPDVKVVIMSAYRDFEAAVESLNLGAARYLKKPISLSELTEVVRTLTEEAS